MNARTTISKDESNILVAIGKIETQMDGLRGDIAGARAEIKDINTGITARLLNLEGNSVSKLEVNPKLDEYETRITDLETSRTEYRATLNATIKAWALFVGVANAALALALTIYFHYH